VRVAENRRQYKKLKASTPCADCGLKYDPHVMDFDHIRGKKKANVSELIGDGYSWETILTEIAKCVLRCSNCHRAATHRRLQYQKRKKREADKKTA